MKKVLDNHLFYPTLREPLEIIIESVSEQKVILLKCPLGLNPSLLGLKAEAAPIIQRMSGKLSIENIQSELSYLGLTSDLLIELILLLEQNLFLDGPSYKKALAELKQRFLLEPIREPAFSGTIYSSEPSQLSKEINQYLLNGSKIELKTEKIKTLMAPHIDYRRGSSCYGKSFSILQNQKPDLVLLIGTAHQYSPHLFHLSLKDFSSPLGIHKTDQDFAGKLSKKYGIDRSFADHLLHKNEHSLELQLPFLSKLLPNVPTVPILVGSFYQMILDRKSPSKYEYYEKFVESLCETYSYYISYNKSVLILAGVDIAHVGKFFGDLEALSNEKMEQIRLADQEYLSFILTQDKEGLFEHIVKDQDARKICGFPTMYTILDLYERLGLKLSGEILDYQQAVDFKTDCAVTFAGLVQF